MSRPAALCWCYRCHGKPEDVDPRYKTDCTCECEKRGEWYPTLSAEEKNMDWTEIGKQTLGFMFGLGVTVVAAVAGDLSGIASFEQISLAGLGVTAVRSGASFVVAFFTQMNAGGK